MALQALDVQHMGVSQGCPLSLTFIDLFFDVMHEHLSVLALEAGFLLGSGHLLPFGCYADDILLLSDTADGLGHLYDIPCSGQHHLALHKLPTILPLSRQHVPLPSQNRYEADSSSSSPVLRPFLQPWLWPSSSAPH